MFGHFLLILNLVGSLVAFDTTPENYTVPISGKCILTCYVAQVRSFKVSKTLHFFVSCQSRRCRCRCLMMI